MTFPAVVKAGPLRQWAQRQTLPAEALTDSEKPKFHLIAIHAEPGGDLGVVWVGVDELWAPDSKTTKQANKDRKGTVHIYDSVVYPRAEAVFGVIADRIKGSGEWIPIVYRDVDEPYAEALRARGCRVREHYNPKPEDLAASGIEMRERIENKRLKVARDNISWAKEFQSYSFEEKHALPEDGFPLISATLHAMALIKSSKAWIPARKQETAEFGGSIV